MRYVQGDVADEMLAQVDGSNNVRWFLTDRLGSIRDITNASGSVINSLNYTAYGEISSETNSANRSRYAWVGQEIDYDFLIGFTPTRITLIGKGRFAQTDSIWFQAGDPNLYRYVGNNPTNATDPNGTFQMPVPAQPFGGILPIVRDALATANEAILSGAQWALKSTQYIKAVREKFDRSTEAKKVLAAGAQNQGVNAIRIMPIPPGFALGNFNGYWVPRSNTILLRSDNSVDVGVAYLLFEALRAKQEQSKVALHADAAAGKIDRATYAIRQEQYGYMLVREHHRIVDDTMKAGEWDRVKDADIDYFGKLLVGAWATEAGYLKAQDTPMPGKGVDDTHTGFYRVQWDLEYKEAYERRNPPRK